MLEMLEPDIRVMVLVNSNGRALKASIIGIAIREVIKASVPFPDEVRREFDNLYRGFAAWNMKQRLTARETGSEREARLITPMQGRGCVRRLDTETWLSGDTHAEGWSKYT